MSKAGKESAKSSEISLLEKREIVKTIGFCIAVVLSFRGILSFLGGAHPGTFERILDTLTSPLVAPFNNYTVSQQSAFNLPVLASIAFVLMITSIIYIILGTMYKSALLRQMADNENSGLAKKPKLGLSATKKLSNSVMKAGSKVAEAH